MRRQLTALVLGSKRISQKWSPVVRQKSATEQKSKRTKRWPASASLLSVLAGSAALAQQPAPSDLVEKGRYLATAGDCVA